MPHTHGISDLTEMRFGLLVVKWTSGIIGTTQVWLCLCDCGTLRNVRRGSLTQGATRSCGCLKRGNRNSLRHGHAAPQSPEYVSWCRMIQRCTYPKASSYHRYGGRGIVVCERWSKSFEDFLADMGPKPTPKHTIDRWPNKRGNYEPGNCRWATAKEQAQNREEKCR